jgi:hypothetical protein
MIVHIDAQYPGRSSEHGGRPSDAGSQHLPPTPMHSLGSSQHTEASAAPDVAAASDAALITCWFGSWDYFTLNRTSRFAVFLPRIASRVRR